jgi:hypothetical protein
MSTMIDLVRRLRRQLGDDPVRSRTVSGSPVPDQAAATDVTVPDGQTSKFRTQMMFEFNDDTGERLEVDSTDPTTNKVTALRAREGTAHAAHTNGTDIVIEPRFSYPQASDTLSEIIDGELWPDVWIFGESTLTYHSTQDYYDPSVTDIEQLVSAYQLVSGHRYSIDFHWLSPEVADDVNFPDGAISIPIVVDYSTIYFAYRVRPTLANLTTTLERLVLMGAGAELLELEEGSHVGPDRSAVDATVGDGAKLRAGLVRWDRFTQTRERERVRLLSLEMEKATPTRSLV